ncbi:hypothetical protein QEH59_09235 [Coraliomargarita sp. SDUM461004]|uniref:Uncharacterized protein n=1 Tax=Thalassobacterium sedimentorum TaxID=3041258 RepID=A0ABU1AIK5_9BACT|nr:hypothetical protein [Coraliomargarita sp. SDUM461004]MDQ8194608.1 hypothetical protein [Coraliomargarita sp. SDUM461004]
MSEDSKAKLPVKLTLSRHLKTEVDTRAQEAAQPDAAQPSPKPSVMKLKRKHDQSLTSTSSNTASDTAADSSDHTSALKQRPEISPTATKPSSSPETAAPAPEIARGKTTDKTTEAAPVFDPKNPFGKSTQESELFSNKPPADIPQTAAQAGQQAAQAASANIDSGHELEKTINQLHPTHTPNNKTHTIIPCIATILLLLLVLLGASYGLWMILEDPQASGPQLKANNQAQSSQEHNSLNPIEKAKATIAQVPVADIEEIGIPSEPANKPSNTATTNSEKTASAPQASIQTKAQVLQANTADDAGTTLAATAAVSVATNNTIDSNKQMISQYLSGIHIDGLRQGDRPMIIIQGERFQVGDLVQAETGLKFDGLRNGRLAFRDQHGIVYLKSF